MTRIAVTLLLLVAGRAEANAGKCAGADLGEAYDCLRSKKLTAGARHELIARLGSVTSKEEKQRAIELLRGYLFAAPATAHRHVIRALIKLGDLSPAAARRVPTGATLVRRIRNALRHRPGHSKDMSYSYMRCFGVRGQKGAIRCHRRELARIRPGHCRLGSSRAASLRVHCSTGWCRPCMHVGIDVRVVIPRNPKKPWTIRGTAAGKGPDRGGCGHGCFEPFQ